MVNKEMSSKFATLVLNAESFLTHLPWPKAFEKDKFLHPPPDVLTFAASLLLTGMCFPNYEEICQSEGFKNLLLGNVIQASFKQTDTPFLSDEDRVLKQKYAIAAFELHIGLHELFGHGSGKLFKRNKDHTLNYDENTIDPTTGKKISHCYESGETYKSKFTAMGSVYEECRAEAVGLYLSLNKDVLKVFGHEGEEAENIIYVNWLLLVWKGMGSALEMYQPSNNKWLQAHSQARYVIMQVLLEAGQGLVRIEETTPGENLLLRLDRSKIETVGKKAIADFLIKLQVYKSTGDIEKAQNMFDYYSRVPNDGPHPWSRWRDIVMAHKIPRIMAVQANTVLKGI